MNQASTRVGDHKCGFELGVAEQNRILHVRMWGFWDDAICTAYERAARTAFARLRGAPWACITDRVGSPPQRQTVSEQMSAVINEGVRSGCVHIAVLSGTSVGKMQDRRLANQAGLTSLSFHDDALEAEDAARDAIKRASKA